MNKVNELFVWGMTYLVIPHTFPDGDAIGSCYALAKFIESIGSHVYIVSDECIPDEYKFLNSEKFVTSEFIKKNLTQIDFAVIVDFSDYYRAACDESIIEMADKVINIDHHVTNKKECENCILDVHASSTGEVIFDIFKAYGHKVTKEEAMGLYTAIVTDTGKFMYSNTSAKTLRAAAELLETGFDVNSVNIDIYQNKTERKLRLLNLALSTLELHLDGQVALMSLKKDNVEEHNCDFIDSDGIVEEGRDIQNVEVSILLKEIDYNTIKVSLRSKKFVKVNDVAINFEGGGHNKAAGCTIYDTIENAKAQILDKVSMQVR